MFLVFLSTLISTRRHCLLQCGTGPLKNSQKNLPSFSAVVFNVILILGSNGPLALTYLLSVMICMFLTLNRTLEPLPGVRDNSWHGVCVTWKSEGGVFMVYYDGRLIQEGNNFKAGVTLSPNRAFTAGVGKQDDMIYSGKLGHINAWPRVLEHPLLAVLSSKCGVRSGELVSWPQFMTGVHGITAVAGDTCPYSGKIITFHRFCMYAYGLQCRRLFASGRSTKIQS